VPHSGQNFAPGASSAWQFAHFAFSCDEPHSEQNFAPSRSSAPHLTHGTFATSIFAPQSPQNFVPAAFCLPQFGHATVCDLLVRRLAALLSDRRKRLPFVRRRQNPRLSPRRVLRRRLRFAPRRAERQPLETAYNDWRRRARPSKLRLSIAFSTSSGREMFST
jgi:hypothetical protein